MWVNETGCNYKDMIRKYGYALSGERAVSKHLMIRGQRISSIAAICTDGLLALETTCNSVNGEMFFDFVTSRNAVFRWFQSKINYHHG